MRPCDVPQNDASVPDQTDLAALRSRIIAAEGPGSERRYFYFKPLWQRALVVLAGPAANFLFAIIVLTGLVGLTGELYRPASGALLVDLIPPERRVTAFSASTVITVLAPTWLVAAMTASKSANMLCSKAIRSRSSS